MVVKKNKGTRNSRRKVNPEISPETEERDRLLALINSMSDEVWFADTEGNFILENQAALQQFNIASPGKMNIRDMAESLEVYRPDGSPRPVEDAAPLRALKGEVVKNAESMIRIPATGDIQYRQESSYPVTNVDGNIIGSVSLVRNITEQKQREAELRDFEHDLNFAQSIAKMGNWRLDVRHDVLTWSDEAYRIFGVSREIPLSYETFLSYVHPDDREYVDKAWQAALQGEDYNIEHRIIVENKVKWVREVAQLEFDQEGILKGGFGTVQDITERKQAIQQMEFRDSILTQIDDVVIAIDNDGRIIYFNKTAEETYGINSEYATGRELKDIFAYRWMRPEDKQSARDSLAAYGNWIGENIHVKGNGEEITVRSSATVLKDHTGAQIGILAVIRDITEYKKAQKIIEQLLVERNQQLQRTQTNFELLVNTMTEGVLLIDSSGNVQFANPAAVKIFDLQGSGSSVYRFGVPMVEGVTEIQVPSEEQVKYLEIKVAATNAIENQEGYFIIARDITEHKYYTQKIQMLSRRIVEAQENERRYIGQEIHDEIGGALTGIKLALNKIQKKLGNEAEMELRKLDDLISETMSLASSLSHDIRPNILIDFGLLDALKWYFENYTARTGIKVKFKQTGLDNKLPEIIEFTIYRMVQESLTNVERYAEVDEVTVNINMKKKKINIVVEDLGRGFEVGHIGQESNGIVGMQDRATVLGGNLSVYSSPGEGTRIICELPLDV